MKPILFNTEMVRAILEGRKTVTRRAIKYSCLPKHKKTLDDFIDAGDPQLLVDCSPYQAGDILWVRETWVKINGEFIYKANLDASSCRARFIENQIGWRPSIHMPKESARLFLRVTGLQVERLQEINGLHAKAEGCEGFIHVNPLYGCPETVHNFKKLWDTTIKPADLPSYGWEANPWVWVIEFERISKEAALGGAVDG